MVLLPAFLIVLSLAFEVNASNFGYPKSLVRDANGQQHLVNPNPYRVVDDFLEPSFIAETDVFFRLYTRANPENDQILKPNDTSSIANSHFDPGHPTRFLIHGWNQNNESEFLVKTRHSYLSVDDFNIIAVDWGKGAQTINYITARYRVEHVGRVTSQMVDTLVKASRVPLDRVIAIGYSLGAHIAGVTGKHQMGRLSTIVGLDPAGPLFTTNSSDGLNRQDAQYVEMVSTNARILGSYSPLGAANFYVNGGLDQPGCGMDLFGICSHSRSWMYFEETITTGAGFRGVRCATFEDFKAGKCNAEGSTTAVRMGGEPSNHGRGVEGVYLVQTNSQAPFAKG
ncbi:pancreatic triacylglycerol lipase [Aedes albopictus]|uniref:Lipase domain-containing protein n=1 Tax=Aedes albopictus TaxID=7160 RepID=A0ABM1ZYH2_AEDAL|nr:pancreatic triacylglycerol lipase-like [Aedes albopictus]